VTAHYLDLLNEQQRAAATYGDGPLLIIAGAGTGKTMTLACRVAHLLERGVPAERILLLTFTRRAAAEMVRRAAAFTAQTTAGRVWGGTFHAMGNRLLRVYAPAVGLPGGFTVMDQEDAADLMSLIRTDLGVAKGERRFPTKHTLVAIYSRMVAGRDKLDDVLERYFPWCREYRGALAAIFEEYTQRKRAQNVLDYDDLLIYWLELVARSPAAASVNERFDHILVDEYQDTNPIQADILLAMRRNCPNLTVVGDDAQAIYSFRAASIRNILDFPKQFPGTQVIKLEQNYRSNQAILDASNAVMAKARNRFTKELWSTKSADHRPQLVHCMDENVQSEAVCRNVLRHLERGVALRKQGVLFRSGHHSDLLEVELSRRNIPFHKYGGLKFMEAAHIKDLLALLRIMENPYDEMSWFRTLFLLPGIGPKHARRIIDEMRAPGPDGYTGVLTEKLRLQPPRLPPAAQPLFAELVKMFVECFALEELPGSPADDEDASDGRGRPLVAVQVARARVFYEPLMRERYENAGVRALDLEQLEQIAGGYRSRRRFLADLTLDPPSSTSDLAGPPQLDEDYLVLSTIHSAKGCEWDVVHVIHAADGMIPSDMALRDREGLDEERRLFYVALTRARDWLYVYFPLRYYHSRWLSSDAHGYAKISRFLSHDVRKRFTEQAAGVGGVEPEDDAEGLPPPRGSGVNDFLRGLWEGS
jgi:DNA helicase-2/ATP-dependent DNA helicase PcrA